MARRPRILVTPAAERRLAPLAALLIAPLLLSACAAGPEAGVVAAPSAAAEVAAELGAGDVEAPEVFQVADQGLWDGRPSLGGIWVAHPDVADPERVIVRNGENGQSVIGALFRRERANPGPAIQVSSDAAAALGMLAGAPASLSVTALRREEPAAPAPEGALAADGIPEGAPEAPSDEAAGAPEDAVASDVAATAAAIVADGAAAPPDEAPADAVAAPDPALTLSDPSAEGASPVQG